MKDDVLKEIVKKRNSVEFEVWGNYALFSDPLTRVGGEKFSYQVPTYQALKGILESIYWKPTLIWKIDAVRVMKKIQTEENHSPIKLSGGNELAYYLFEDVMYQVSPTRVERNQEGPGAGQNEHKHHNIAKRMIEKAAGAIFLGCASAGIWPRLREGEATHGYGES